MPGRCAGTEVTSPGRAATSTIAALGGGHVHLLGWMFTFTSEKLAERLRLRFIEC
jgi:hypothetical protein